MNVTSFELSDKDIGKIIHACDLLISPEYTAQCFQAYRLAKMLIEGQLKQEQDTSNKAIIVDIDQTIINNTTLFTGIRDKEMPLTDNELSWWDENADYVDLPGALEFCNWAYSKGYTFFYVSNKLTKHFDKCFSELTRLGFPIMEDQLILRDSNKISKEARRQKILKKYEVSLLLGDKFLDFTDIYDLESCKNTQIELVKKYKEDFGSKYVLLPNPTFYIPRVRDQAKAV